ncbi:taste receptor type 2 member 40-like [Rana temporaria]|uniref:taste receptor type 2 member 40-like n=1 Tax=Rana temporaria TaxID=8407 RepID=UPI001AAC80EA|nr:taste receptor type 2 member 40-like [Rana temporaria]
MGNLDIIRKKGKLSPTDVIFLGKGIVNILLQCVLSLQGMLFVFAPKVVYIRGVYIFFRTSVYFLNYYNFWLTFWLSAHYCTSITNLSYGFFIWIKRIVSNFLSHLLFLTALGLFIINVPFIWTLNVDSTIQSSENSTVKTSFTGAFYQISFPYFLPMTFLGVFLPFFLILLCLVLTYSFLLRHVWRVKNNDSGSTRPNLQAHVTALRTIFFLLLMFSSFFMTRLIFFIGRPTMQTDPIAMACWAFLSSSPLAEAAVIFQASNKLRRTILRRFWTRSRRNTET